MDHTIAEAIRSFITSDPPPTIADLLNRDAPKYEWTNALVAALLGQPTTAQSEQATGATRFISRDGTSVLRVATTASGAHVVEGLVSEDMDALLGAIRNHEVESYDLAMLPPDMRKAHRDNLCKKMGISTEKLHRLTELWISEK